MPGSANFRGYSLDGEIGMDGFDLPLEPPVRYSRPRSWMLRTVGEAIDYINSSLTDAQQGHQLVKAARDLLYYAAETGIRTDVTPAREALERALRELKIGGK